MRLTEISMRQPAFVDRIDWSRLPATDGERLKEFGLFEGASVEVLHRSGWFGRGVLACRIGRMTIAMRRVHAEAIMVRTGAEAVVPGADRAKAPGAPDTVAA